MNIACSFSEIPDNGQAIFQFMLVPRKFLLFAADSFVWWHP